MLTAAVALIATFPGPVDTTSAIIGGALIAVGLVLWAPSVIVKARQRHREAPRPRGCPTSPAPTPKPWGGAR